MTVHTGFHAVRHVFSKCVGSHRDNWDLGPLAAQRAYGSGGVESVHHRHLHVHKTKIVFADFRFAHLVYADLTVFSAFAGYTVHLEYGADNFPVHVVVLSHQHVHTGNSGIVLLRLRRFVLYSEKVVNFFVKRGSEKRLTDKSACPGGLGLLLYIRPVVSGYKQDRHVYTRLFADLTDDLNAVHSGHFPVYDYYVVVVARAVTRDGLSDRVLARRGGIRLCAERRKRFFCRFKRYFVVIHQKYVDGIEAHGVGMLFGDLQLK